MNLHVRKTTLGAYKKNITQKMDIFNIKHPQLPLPKRGKTKWHPPLPKLIMLFKRVVGDSKYNNNNEIKDVSYI
jgi:hypothetical protein